MSVEIQQFALFLILCKTEVTTQLSRVVIGESHAVYTQRDDHVIHCYSPLLLVSCDVKLSEEFWCQKLLKSDNYSSTYSQ